MGAIFLIINIYVRNRCASSFSFATAVLVLGSVYKCSTAKQYTPLIVGLPKP